MRTIATASESFSTVESKSTASADGLGRPWPSTSSKIAGITSAPAARNSIVAWMLAAWGLNFWRSCLIPPTSIEAPSTSRMLPMIEPTIEALTTS